MATAESVWNNCLKFIKDNIQIQAYKTWFEPIIPVKLSEDVLSIQVPSKFFYEWLEEHYVKILRIALTKELGSKARLVYVIKMENTFGNLNPFTEKIPSQYKTDLPSQKVDFSVSNIQTELKNPFVIPGIKNLKIESQLNPNYTFDNFLEGDANRLARSAGLAVSNKPGGTSFNPLLIFGGVGLGKTISEEQNYSGTISQFAYDEDIEGVVYSQIVFAGRIGYRINQSFHIIATIGGSFFNQYQERFDSFYILGTDGWYYVHTDVSKTEAYVKGSVVYKINQFGIELGLANSGFGIGLNYFF